MYHPFVLIALQYLKAWTDAWRCKRIPLPIIQINPKWKQTVRLDIIIRNRINNYDNQLISELRALQSQIYCRLFCINRGEAMTWHFSWSTNRSNDASSLQINIMQAGDHLIARHSQWDSQIIKIRDASVNHHWWADILIYGPHTSLSIACDILPIRRTRSAQRVKISLLYHIQ